MEFSGMEEVHGILVGKKALTNGGLTNWLSMWEKVLPHLYITFDNQLWKMERPKFQVENPRRK